MLDISELLARRNVVERNGHFVYTSGRHGDTYIVKRRLTMRTQELSLLASAIADICDVHDIDVVAAPAMGAITLGSWVAHHLTIRAARDIYSIFSEKKDNDTFKFSQTFIDVLDNKSVLIVEDIVTTGGSAKKMVDLVRSHGGVVKSVVCICDRGNVSAEDIGVTHFHALVSLDFQSWASDDCPLCRDGKPLSNEHGKTAK